MDVICQFEYGFHAVGQGLFAAGRIQPRGRAPFHWVYDCGTVSSRHILLSAINKFHRSVRHIDLLTISHFDEDHINGVVELISRCSVDTILLPYIPLWQRLLIAFTEGVDLDDELMRFAVDPVEYLKTVPNANIRQIIFVLPSGREERPSDDSANEPEPIPDNEQTKGKWLLDVDTTERPETFGSDWNWTQSDGSALVGFLKPGGRVKIPGLWEFVPYNDQGLAIETKFRETIQGQCKELIENENPEIRQSILEKIKTDYRGQFHSRTAQWANTISLFLYSGPVLQKDGYVGGLCSAGSALGIRQINSCSCHPFLWHRRAAILYTGDGYLDREDRLDAITSFLGDNRIESTAVFQVMHHGAEANWFEEVSSRINPSISVFSSDPTRKRPGHPHRMVWDAFWPYGAIQVDKSDDASICGQIRLLR